MPAPDKWESAAEPMRTAAFAALPALRDATGLRRYVLYGFAAAAAALLNLILIVQGRWRREFWLL